MDLSRKLETRSDQVTHSGARLDICLLETTREPVSKMANGVEKCPDAFVSIESSLSGIARACKT